MVHLNDPVAAYSQIAPQFQAISEQRKSYLEAVESRIAANIPTEARTLLDVGAGDGTRARRIAQATGITHLTLLEPAEGMRSAAQPGEEILTIRAESLHTLANRHFDAITCLWNVLGHIFPAEARLETLRQFRRLTAPNGRIFIDVNHRYNIRHYGLIPTIPRFLKDLLNPNETNGDVKVTWQTCSTQGHVFTHCEFAALTRRANLKIERRQTLDYETGQLRRFALEGHLLYILRPA